MKFSLEAVKNYVNIVEDDNPIHVHIVPGQMVVEMVWHLLKWQPKVYKVKYQQPIRVDEQLEIRQMAHLIQVVGANEETKLTIRYM
ncbi:hypothetical protein HIR68_10350 [Staphylococcus coagulans]|uniref:hypothetical protein n=1 Tax=Staphylococcus coagulans TaxID=74706 RepID=UPI001BE704C0|nr:hypothetical protein [Staphylococcus coagulans]MBT2831287.1 hypothetical protein [Staphylococcus coagulans]MBT2860753.1 hypothetical protein [Staphylococcus coagulans]MBU3872609.1 hypothetical protein [Staphylococcus coagulans]